MANKTVCIEREYGSNGKKIAEWLSKNMGIQCFDKEALKDTAVKNNLVPEGGKDGDGDYNMYEKAILFLAEKHSCIFVGTCASTVLQGKTKNLNVFIKADLDSKIRWAMASEKVDEEKARQLIEETDKKRKEYRKIYSGREGGEGTDYDIIITSSKFGIEGTSELIRSCMSRI